ncbi:MAG TPA: phosphatase PAP2 family protein [Bryobacteraceae bacterium]|nr:phosphatase PAP2 family protein [Bryobacteraceae bacterium]
MMLASDIGTARSLALQDLIAIALFWFRRRRRQAVLAALSLSGAIVLSSALKIAFPRARPAPYFNLAVPPSSSFPSGHALESFCLYATLAWLFATVSGPFPARLAAWIAALAILFIGFSRLYLGLHYPTDVVAGYAAGAVWTALLAIFQTKLYTCG